MIYSRETLITGGYKKCIGEDGANEDKRIDKFDKKVVRPFLDELIALCEKHHLAIDSYFDGTLVLNDFDHDIAKKYRTVEVNVGQV